MAPSDSQKKVIRPGEKDLRMFFKAGTSSKTPTSTLASQHGSQKSNAIQISDEERKANKSQIAETQTTTISVDSEEDEYIVKNQYPKWPKSSNASKKRKSITVMVSSDDEAEDSPPKKKLAVISSKSVKPTPKASSSKPVPKLKQKVIKRNDEEDFDTEPSEESSDEDFDDDEEPRKLSKKPAPVGKGKVKVVDEEKPKKPIVNWAAAKAAKLARPIAHGTKEIPNGAIDALAGLSFVFTGELSSFSREEAVDLAKRFGGRVVLQPSSKTDYVILGEDAGPSKLAAIKKHGINTLDEDKFLKLIGTRKGLGKVDEKTKKKMEKEQEEIKKAVKEMEKREKREQVATKSGKNVDPQMQLWTTRYAPQSLKEVCGNKGQIEKLQQWLTDWPTSLKSGFRKPGKNGMNMYRAVLLTGSPGIGKTTSAHLCAKLAGFTPIELNASDARSKKLVENGMNINNKSLDGYVQGANDTNSAGVPITDRTCLIMDEVDGMSAGDRGGVGALNALIKKTKIPIICIANDRQAQKLKPLLATTFNMSFQKYITPISTYASTEMKINVFPRPQVNAVRSRILSIAFKEKMKIPANVVDQLITGVQSDIRQVLNMLSTWKLSNTSMDFDEGKHLAKSNEKYSILSPFDITSKMLGPYLFSATSRETLGDKMEYYFQDHSFVPLFIQENYLKTQPAQLKNIDGPERIIKELELMEKASSSISDADLVDALIHGPEQHWGLMPLHAVCSTVRPASFIYGTGAHYGGPNSMSFPQWLGQNSKQNKLSRQLNDVQIRMRLKVSGDKNEIRQSYIPALFPHIVSPLMDIGSSAVDGVIEHMDQYYLSKEEWDTIVELGVDVNKDDGVLKQISTATKTSFTRRYNASEHPIPFHKAQDLGKAPKKLAGGPAPDLEEAYEVDDIPDDVSDDEMKTKDSDDISKDSLIKAPKKKKKAAANTALASSSTKGKTKKS